MRTELSEILKAQFTPLIMRKLFVLFFLSLLSNCIKAQFLDKLDVDTSFEVKRNEFLTPNYIYKNIGKPITNKDRLEKNLNIQIEMHKGGIDYYSINETNVGLRFKGQVLLEISFRYFGDDGMNYETSLINAGYILRNTKKTINIESEASDFDMSNGEIRFYKKGNVICKVYDGTYLAFTFYRTISSYK